MSFEYIMSKVLLKAMSIRHVNVVNDIQTIEDTKLAFVFLKS